MKDHPMKELPYFKFYIAEWLTGDIHDMPTLSQGFFIKFLIKAWGNGGYLDNDSLLQQKLNICSTDDQQAFKLLIDHRIIKEKDGKLFAAFQIEQIEEFIADLKQKSKAGKESAKARALKRLNSTEIKHLTETQRNLNVIATESQRSLNSVSTDFNEEKESKKESKKDKEIITPISPKGDQGQAKQEKKKPGPKLTKEEEKRLKIEKNTDLMNRIGSWFGRKPETLWSIYEAKALEQVAGNVTEEELNYLEAYYTASIEPKQDWRRRNIETLLNNWGGEIDRAIQFSDRTPDASIDKRVFKPL